MFNIRSHAKKNGCARISRRARFESQLGHRLSSWFSSIPPGMYQDSFVIKSYPLPAKSLFTSIISFDAVQSDIYLESGEINHKREVMEHNWKHSYCSTAVFVYDEPSFGKRYKILCDLMHCLVYNEGIYHT
jgi:hypothetical protein